MGTTAKPGQQVASEADTEAALSGGKPPEDANADQTRVDEEETGGAGAPTEETPAGTEAAAEPETTTPEEESADFAEETEEESEAAVEAAEDEAAKKKAAEEAAAGDEEGKAEAEKREAQEATAAEYANLLPDEVKDAYPDEVVAKAAAVVGYSPEEVKADPKLQALLTSKISADVREKALKLESAVGEFDEEVVEEAEPKEAEAEAPATPTDGAGTPEQVFEHAQTFAKSFVTDKGAELFVDKLSAAYKALYDAEEKGDKVAALVAKRAVTEVMLGGVVLGTSNVIPVIGPSIVDNRLNEREQLGSLYSSVRNRMAKLPAFQDLKQAYKSGAMKKLMGAHPEISEMQFKNSDGKTLTLNSEGNVYRQLEYALALIRGTKPPKSPTEAVNTAIKTTEANARKLKNRAELGRLTPGQTRGRIAAAGGATDDEWFDRIAAVDKQSDPLSAESTRAGGL